MWSNTTTELSSNSTQLQAEFRARQHSLVVMVTNAYDDGSRPIEENWYHDFAILAKANLTIPSNQIEFLVNKTIQSAKADFYLVVLTRVMALAPGQYDEKVQLVTKSIPGLWMTEGDNQGVFWSENHFLMWHSCSMILAQFGIPLPEGWRERIVFYLEDKIDIGFYEFSSQTYYPYSLAGLLNLHDFAPDAEIKELARMATLRLLQDFVLMTTEDGFFRTATGRATSLGHFTNREQNNRQEHVAAMLGLGSASLPSRVERFSGPSLGFLATSDIDVGELLTQRLNHVDELVPIGRSIGEFRKRAAAALSDKRDRITAAWSMGQYFHPDTAYELFDNIDSYDLWDNDEFSMFAQFQWIGPRIARLISVFVVNFTSASILNADMALYRHGGVMLTSLQNGYFRGMRPAQQQPHFAVAGPATVFTHASGDLNPKFEERKYLQTHLPHIKQNSNVALLLYQPNRDLSFFLKSSLPVSLHWPGDHFSEETVIENWKIARYEQSYVAMWTPCLDDPDGFIVCNGKQQVWASIVGTEETHGSFDNFTQVVSQSAPTVHGGRCFGATLAVDGQEVTIDKWCRDFGEGNKLLAVLISYSAVTLIVSLLLSLKHCRLHRIPVMEDEDEPEHGILCGLMPRSTCKFIGGVLLYFATFPILVFGVAVGFYGDGSPAAIAGSAIAVMVYVALHAAFVWYARKKYVERKDKRAREALKDDVEEDYDSFFVADERIPEHHGLTWGRILQAGFCGG